MARQLINPWPLITECSMDFNLLMPIKRLTALNRIKIKYDFISCFVLIKHRNRLPPLLLFLLQSIDSICDVNLTDVQIKVQGLIIVKTLIEIEQLLRASSDHRLIDRVVHRIRQILMQQTLTSFHAAVLLFVRRINLINIIVLRFIF